MFMKGHRDYLDSEDLTTECTEVQHQHQELDLTSMSRPIVRTYGVKLSAALATHSIFLARFTILGLDEVGCHRGVKKLCVIEDLPLRIILSKS